MQWCTVLAFYGFLPPSMLSLSSCKYIQIPEILKGHELTGFGVLSFSKGRRCEQCKRPKVLPPMRLWLMVLVAVVLVVLAFSFPILSSQRLMKKNM